MTLAVIGYQQAVPHDVLNGYLATTDLVSDLRGFVGTVLASSVSRETGSVVRCLGAASPGDGLGGTYYWNAASTAADNLASGLATVIQPTAITGSNPGRWLLLPSGRLTAQSSAPVSLASLTPATIASLALGPGLYDVSVAVWFSGAPATTVDWLRAGASTVAAQFASIIPGIVSRRGNGAQFFTDPVPETLLTLPVQIVGPATAYAVAAASFEIGALSAQAAIWAARQ